MRICSLHPTLAALGTRSVLSRKHTLFPVEQCQKPILFLLILGFLEPMEKGSFELLEYIEIAMTSRFLNRLVFSLPLSVRRGPVPDPPRSSVRAVRMLRAFRFSQGLKLSRSSIQRSHSQFTPPNWEQKQNVGK